MQSMMEETDFSADIGHDQGASSVRWPTGGGGDGYNVRDFPPSSGGFSIHSLKYPD